jgi:hypothetical protein
MVDGVWYNVERQRGNYNTERIDRVFLRCARLRVSLIAVTLALLVANLHGQASVVTGTITYRNGKPAVNVFVSIANQYKYTDVGGRYKLDGVPQGRQHMIIKRDATLLWEGDVTINGKATTVNKVLP